MSASKRVLKGAPKTVLNYKARQDKIARMRQASRLHDSGMSIVQVAREMGLSTTTVSGYIQDRASAEDVIIKADPRTRSCLRCRSSFRPSSFGRFMCDQCNDFAKGAML